MSKHLVRIAAVGLGLALVFAAAALGSRKVECAGNLCVADNGGIFPSKLPKHGSAPITARIFGEIHSRDGSHPPAIENLELDVDNTIGIDAVGLPTCRARQIESRTSAEAKRACADALVGAGSPTMFTLKFGGKFTYKGRTKSFLTASCPTGHWVTKGHVVFGDQTQLGLAHVFPCTPKG